MKIFYKSFLILSMLFLTSCQFFSSVSESLQEKDYDSEVTSVTLAQTTLNITVGESENLTLSINPSNYQGKVHVKWEFDETYVSCKTDNFGIIITGVKAGSTYVKASCNGIISTCLLSVISNGDDVEENPYIYSNYSVIQLKPGDTTTISASLYGGSISDMESFTWEVKDSTIADIDSARNNCVITANKAGSTQITCTHPNAKYSYTFVVYVYTDKLNEPYITTTNNVFSINKNEESSKILTVDLINPISSTYANEFEWKLADENSESIIKINSSLNTAEVIPLKAGTAQIIVSHKNAKFDLTITVRVITLVENVYIGLTKSTVIVTGEETITVQASLENYTGYVNPDSFKWSVPDDSLKLAECTASGNSMTIKGKKNGTFKIKVSNEKSEFSRNILVILTQQLGSAIDASMYITTDQNYVQTQVGREPTTINVRLVGGVEGEDDVGDDTTNFSWYIKGGSENGIVEIQEKTGSVKDLDYRSAASSGNFCNAKLVISPLKEGELTIVVTHPRCLYDTEISVKVYAEDALVNPKMITTDDSLIKLLNNETTTITATLKNKDEGDENKVQWSSADESKVSVSPAEGQTTVVSACGSGNGQTYITAHLDGALSDRKVLVLTADTEEELNSMKGIYSDSSYLRISVKETKTLSVEYFGFTSSNAERISWSSSDNTICSVNGDSTSSYCSSANVTANGAGSATITASITDCEPVVFEVTVLEEGKSSEIFDENAGYLTTNINAVVIETVGDSTDLSVTGVKISDANMQKYTKWTMTDVNAVENDPVFDLAGSPGSTVTLTANKSGKSVLKVTNKDSANSLTINAKCGELYEWTDDYIIYIQTTDDTDVFNLVKGKVETITFELVNASSGTTGEFSYLVTQGSDCVEIVSGGKNGILNIKGVEAGQALITVSNTLAGEITKEVLINVGNSEEELSSFKYLTTSNNVVTIDEGGYATISCEIQNSETNITNDYSWISLNSNVASVTDSTGNYTTVYGKAIGTTNIKVSNSNCKYGLDIIVNVVNPIAAAEDPYISCKNIVTCTVGGDKGTIAAELVGGTDADNQNFSWNIVDSSIATLQPMNDSAQIVGLKEGVTQVVVSHPKASVSRSILIIVEPKTTTNCYISLDESIIKMSPSDGEKTITATLVNGEADDIYDFKWWADSYDKIDINFTGNSCVVSPISPGTVNLHCSHPKATYSKDIILYISKFDDFDFASDYVELTTGTDTFVNMEIPATDVEYQISYSSSNNSLCTVSGNSSVCILHPGTLSDGKTSESCTITASLQTKSGEVKGKAELLVSVSKKDETKPYIGLYPDSSETIITMNKGEKKNISAKLYGNCVDTTSAGLKWSINNDSGEFIKFTSAKDYGDTVQIEATHSGKTTINITHSESNSPLTLYVIVNGVDAPTVSLNKTNLSIVIGEEKQTIVASVKNDTGEELEWSVEPANQDFFTFTTSGTKAFLYAKNSGDATVYCKIPSNNSIASCKVSVTEAPSINFFVYDNEENFTYENGTLVDKRNKNYLTTFQIYPGETKPIHFETVPAKDKISQWYRGDNSYFDIDETSAGYLESWTDPVSKKTYYYPDGVGTISVIGKTSEGSSILRATTASAQQDSVSITNGYNYLLTLDKTIVSSTPKDVHNNNELLYINYEIRPACSKLIITNQDTQDFGKNLNLKNGTLSKDGYWVIDTHSITDDTNSSGIVKGTLEFEVNGEVNCNVEVKGVNENLISTGSSSKSQEEFGKQILKIQVYYSKHTFIPKIVKQVPYINNTVYSDSEKNASYSKYDSSTNTIFLGDGEFISGTIDVDESNEPYSNVLIKSVEFSPLSDSSFRKDMTDSNPNYETLSSVQKDLVKADSISGSYQNSIKYSLWHQKDYGVYTYRSSKSTSTFKSSYSILDKTFDSTKGLQNMYRLSLESDRPIENLNETVKETSYVGYLKVSYLNYALGSGVTEFKIPVYVQVRNIPCSDNDYFKPYKN